MAPGFWDDDEVKAAASGGGQYMKFDSVGTEVEGTILKLGKRRFNADTKDERLAFEVIFDGDVPTLTAGQVMLQQALAELRPEPGQKLKVRLVEVEKRGAKTLKRFWVQVTRKDGTVETVDQSKGGVLPEPPPPSADLADPGF